MRFALAVLLMVSTVEPISAQDQPTPVKTLKIQQSPPEDTALYKIDADGIVKIDWEAVETLASTKADRTLSPFAEVMLAIRDKKWKPMGR